MMQRLFNLVSLAVIAAAVLVGYQFVDQGKRLEQYREKLQKLDADYQQLAATYNQAVKRTAVTQLLVEDGKLSVIIRGIDGRTQTIETGCDPSREVYVDYVVLDQRLWIRRVFDDRTPPMQGTVINPLIEPIDWQNQTLRYGKAVYRQLGEGRWIVTVTGQGSLGLARLDEQQEPALVAPPTIRDFDPLP